MLQLVAGPEARHLRVGKTGEEVMSASEVTRRNDSYEPTAGSPTISMVSVPTPGAGS